MALREERPADFTDEERWGVHWLSTPALIGGLVLISVSACICKMCAAIHLLPLGVIISFILVVPGTAVFILPIPEGDLWHGQGTLLVKILARLVVHASEPSVLIRHLPLMGDGPEKVFPVREKKRRKGKKGKTAGKEKEL